MFASWPIRKKLFLFIALSLVIVATLAFSAFKGGYAYRNLAKSISGRAMELPLAIALSQRVADLEVPEDQSNETQFIQRDPSLKAVTFQTQRLQFGLDLAAAKSALREYSAQIITDRYEQRRLEDVVYEQDMSKKIEESITELEELNRDEESWLLNATANSERIKEKLDGLQGSVGELIDHLEKWRLNYVNTVQVQYRTWIILTWITSTSALGMLGLVLWLAYSWILRPLQELVRGSRRVAGGEFDHRIKIDGQDEIGELAAAMNEMTARFQQIRDDLDSKVKRRTMEVVRNEQLASVGVLAAGVAHEINNPLASIALCSEALENRLVEIIQNDDIKPDAEQREEITVLRNYLRMIQDEAFRCKDITERLLDFARQGDSEKHHVDMEELVKGVMEIVSHLGKNRGKEIVFHCQEPVTAYVSSQEMKQVVLNLLTNALESLQAEGSVHVTLRKEAGEMELTVEDDGCGMTGDTLSHVFEPFFTNRLQGQGTGLGLAITHRIVSDHGGRIFAESDGPGHGSRFRVIMPLLQHEKENVKRYQVA